VSPLTLGKLSHSSETLIGGGSPIIQWWKDKCCYWHATACSGPKSKTIGRQLKEKREKKKEESRTYNAQLHATITVAGVTAAIAAIAAATAVSSIPNTDEKMAKTDLGCHISCHTMYGGC
jgi:hypothetical protein